MEEIEAIKDLLVRIYGENKGGLAFNKIISQIEKSEIPKDRIEHKNIVVFIGPPESMEGIEKASKTGSWSSLGVFQPFSQ